MSEQYVPALRRRFLEDMRIKGLQPKTQTMYRRRFKAPWCKDRHDIGAAHIAPEVRFHYV